jgi:hypothetical protein
MSAASGQFEISAISPERRGIYPEPYHIGSSIPLLRRIYAFGDTLAVHLGISHVDQQLAFSEGASVRIIVPNETGKFKHFVAIGDKSAYVPDQAVLHVSTKAGTLIERIPVRQLDAQPFLLNMFTLCRIQKQERRKI